LSPAKPRDLYIDEENLYALVVFEDDDINKAIGREGINIRLTNIVTGFNIEAIKASKYDQDKDLNINDIDISEKFKKILIDNNIKTTKDFYKTDKDVILSFKGVGEKTYEKLADEIKQEVSRL